jgi:hypothetical protein
VHCYDDRFRPYVRADLERVISEGERAFQRIVANLPDDFTYRTKTGERRTGRIILAGGEVLLDGVRERVFYPTMDAIRAKYGDHGVRISVQTTGDLLEAHHIEAMLKRKVWTIAISGMDDFHVGMEGDKRASLMEKIRAIMAQHGVEETSLGGRGRDYTNEDGPFFLFFGAQPESWIGEIWPRGRAWSNGLSRADQSINFCARQSGGKNFMNHGHAGSEVAIEPDGSVYPCCLKTKAPLGNLTEERLIDILDSLKGHPAFEAINAGDPEAMGETFGVARAAYQALSVINDAHGRAYANPCIGCDRFFETHLNAALADIRAQRRAAI